MVLQVIGANFVAGEVCACCFSGKMGTMVPNSPRMDSQNGARAAAIGMIVIVAVAMIIALFGWHPWSA